MLLGMRRVVFLAFDRMQLLDLVGPADVFDAATRALGAAPGITTAQALEVARRRLDETTGYRVVVATADGQPVRAASGVQVGADMAFDDIPADGIDTIVVSGGLFVDEALEDGRLVETLRRLAPGARRVASVCSGALVLGAAGLLDGKRATAHWACGETLSERYPSVRLEPDRIFVRDGSVLTSAGVTAGMDLALALVEEDHGPEVARIVARWLVMFVQRPGGQSQFSERLAIPLPLGSPIRALLDDIVAHPAADHRVPELARRAALSERHLARVFAEQTRMTPARFVERVRVEAARNLLEASDMPVDSVATRTGFGSDETMRRAFLRVLGVGPAAYRERFASVAA
jgi:transcriptional regulator GlxA family with amidase domain